MPLNPPAKITFPLDIPGVDVLQTELTPERHFLITVESRQETTTCGICQQEIRCNYGHGSESFAPFAGIGLRNLHCLRPKRGQWPPSQRQRPDLSGRTACPHTVV